MNVFEGLCVVDGKDAEEALPRPHVLVPHGAVLLLTCSVQDVQQTRLPVNHHLLPVRVLQSSSGNGKHSFIHQQNNVMVLNL